MSRWVLKLEAIDTKNDITYGLDSLSLYDCDEKELGYIEMIAPILEDVIYEECKPELFKEEKNEMTLISHIDYNGEIDIGSLKNPSNEIYVKFLTELTSIFAKYKYTMMATEECYISIIDKNCNNVAWFYDIFDHDDVADDYVIEAKVGNKLNGEFDQVDITVTRACCANSNLETTVVDCNKGIGYTVCNNCETKRDWR